MPHYSYVYMDYYYYKDEMLKLIDEVKDEREQLRKENKIITTFAEDLKNKLLGIARPLREKREKPYKINGTWFNADGSVMSAEDVGRV